MRPAHLTPCLLLIVSWCLLGAESHFSSSRTGVVPRNARQLNSCKLVARTRSTSKKNVKVDEAHFDGRGGSAKIVRTMTARRMETLKYVPMSMNLNFSNIIRFDSQAHC
jgi:hypothetical protein